MNKGILWIKLDQRAKESLLSLIKPKYSKIYGDHVTLLYDVDLNLYQNLIGNKQKVGVIEECWDDKVHAVRVEIDKSIPCQIENPHITISAIDGVPPVKANEMIAGEHQTKTVEEGLSLDGTIEVYEFR